MMLWILIAVLTAIAALSILVPLAKSRPSGSEDVISADEAVYREQLGAIETELERGLIDAEAAEAARTEIARRLLAANDKNQKSVGSGIGGSRLRLVQGLAIVALPLAALGLYLGLGSPDLKDQPLEARLNEPAENQSVDVLVARVERHLADNPEDGQGWSIIAPVYMSMGQPKNSARAYSNALRLLGPNQEWFTDMGEALTMANQGIVSADARSAFESAVRIEPEAVKPRFFLALALGQEGKTDQAVSAWENLLEGADGTASWVPAARQELANLKAPIADVAGPDAADIAAAEEMSGVDRQAMIATMVQGLAARLEANGGNVGEWQQLMRAYMVLGKRQEAVETLKRAEEVFAAKPADLARIKDAAGQLGLTGS